MMNNEDPLNQDQDKADEPRATTGFIASAMKSLLQHLAVFFSHRKTIIILSILGITLLIMTLLSVMRPEARKRPIPETVVKVDVTPVASADYPVIVNTNGTIQATTRGNLVSQIRGEIVRVSDNFKNGGIFKAGDILIEVDDRDYVAEVSQASAAVSQASAALRQEQALARQAKSDWERLGNSGRAPDLVVRRPQLAAAQAQMDSATARFETAQLNLERTKIKAPYDGRVINRNAVLGQYVSIGTPLAEIFSTDGVEVRLPLSQAEYSQLGLDRLNTSDINQQFSVVLRTQLANQEHNWDAKITRTDSTFNLNTRQIDVIAEVVDPFSTKGNRPPLKIGQFVNAQIQGQTLKNVTVVPNNALREGSYVFLSRDEVLVKVPVVVTWQDDRNALIESGLNEGDLVVTTSLNSTLAGAKVKYNKPAIVDAQPSESNDTDIGHDEKADQADTDLTQSNEASTTETADQETKVTESNGEKGRSPAPVDDTADDSSPATTENTPSLLVQPTPIEQQPSNLFDTRATEEANNDSQNINATIEPARDAPAHLTKDMTDNGESGS